MVEIIANDSVYATEAPSNQSTINLFAGWSSKFPAFVGVTAGPVPLFEDSRVVWAISRLGGVAGKTVLELGPLEGGHTYMLSQAGAKSVIAIEANKNCFMRCLVSKNLLGMDRAKFLFGDFISYLRDNDERFDVIWAAGILYHMIEPTALLKRIGELTDQVHIWTHYVPDAGYTNEPWSGYIHSIENRDVDGISVPHYIRPYMDKAQLAAYSGGVYQHACWLRRGDIIDQLKRTGLSNIEIEFEDVNHSSGPCFALVASR